jgi:aspartyl-tRNA(Asn)/glutamyl-tRNA(Gln) amidotransferase subunit A
MTLPAPPADIHATRQALAVAEITFDDIIGHAAAAARSPACRHAFMPGSLEQSPVPAIGKTFMPLAGIPVSIKDLFDVAGEVTSAGSTVLAGAPPAVHDCAAVARLRAAGAVLAGRTNMVEFAFSAVGINPHYGTPVNPADASVERIPGGSSSGAAVSVATGAALAALGSDTGGSLRIPAALCGLVGFKGTARRVPTSGAIPLSTTLDTVGAITKSVRDAVLLHEVLTGNPTHFNKKPLSDCLFAVVKNQMQDDLDPGVAAAFEGALRTLRNTGAQIEEIDIAEIGELAALYAGGGFSSAESYAWHRKLLATHQAEYDPRVARRILRGADMSAADYVDLVAARKRWIHGMEARLGEFDAVLSPTVPIVAPPIASVLTDDDEFFRVNNLLLRNTSLVNMLDGCAISIPCHRAGELPAGLMIWQAAMHDDVVLGLAALVESALHHSLQK